MPTITSDLDTIVLSAASGSDTVQQAIDQAISQQKPLFIDEGTYSTGALNVYGPITIIANRGRATLVSSTSNALTISIEHSSRIADVTIDGLVIDGQNKGFSVSGRPGLIRARNVDRLKVVRCFFQNSDRSAIDLESVAGDISDNEFWNNRQGIFSIDAVGLLVRNNYVRDSKDMAIGVWRNTKGFDGTIISENRIYTIDNDTGGSGQFGNGISVYRLDGVTIEKNIILNANYSSIRSNACSNVIITENQIFYNRECAIFVENPFVSAGVPYQGVSIAGNTIYDSGEGIKVSNPDVRSIRASVVGNTIQNISTKSFAEWTSPTKNPGDQYTRVTNACGIIVTSDCVVANNTVEDCSVAGIVIHPTGTWDPGAQSRPDEKAIYASAIANGVRNCSIGIGYNDFDNRGFGEIAENMVLGASNASITRVQVTDLSGGGLPSGNGLGPYVRVSGAPDIGASSTSITDRFSFHRNKVIPATV